jgi:hypothetical protein
MTGLVDLQKAVKDLRRLNHFDADTDTWAIPQQQLFKFEKLFSCFQAEQTAKEQALRKLLKERPKPQDFPASGFRHAGINMSIWKKAEDGWVEKIKKVFDEGSLRKGETDQK